MSNGNLISDISRSQLFALLAAVLSKRVNLTEAESEFRMKSGTQDDAISAEQCSHFVVATVTSLCAVSSSGW